MRRKFDMIFKIKQQRRLCLRPCFYLINCFDCWNSLCCINLVHNTQYVHPAWSYETPAVARPVHIRPTAALPTSRATTSAIGGSPMACHSKKVTECCCFRPGARSNTRPNRWSGAKLQVECLGQLCVWPTSPPPHTTVTETSFLLHTFIKYSRRWAVWGKCYTNFAFIGTSSYNEASVESNSSPAFIHVLICK